jgi:hypothetical protein
VHFALLAKLVRRIHVVGNLSFAILHIIVFVLGIDVFRLRDPIKVASQIFLDLLFLAEFLEIPAIFRFRPLF